MGHHWPVICKVLSIAVSCHGASFFPHVAHNDVVDDLPLLQLLLTLLRKN